jgi:LacI family transcriptional regulator
MRRAKKIILQIDIRSGFGRKLLRGIVKYSCLYGPWIFFRDGSIYEDRGITFSREIVGLGSHDASIIDKRKCRSRLKSLGADGIITQTTELLHTMVSLGLPIIATDIEQLPNLPLIIDDYSATGKMAAEYFLARGFKRFAFCGFGNMSWSCRRGTAFSERAAKAGVQTHIYNYNYPEPKKQPWSEDERTYMSNWLKSLPKPIGLLACNDYRGEQVIETCRIAGLQVPNDVAVLGVDDDDLFCNLSSPKLSSISYNTEVTGYKVAELLDKLMAGQKMISQKIIYEPTHVITRESTDIMAMEDHDVANALGFIREHTMQLIQVDDVANAIGLSRRALYKRFKKVVGYSVYEEIKRVRMEQIAKFLIETDLSVSQIAFRFGYNGVDHIARYFKQKAGLSPAAYRIRFGCGQKQSQE